MQISVHQLSKRFSKDWIFRDINFDFKINNSYAVVGSNGAGKSTFLQILSGKLPKSKGKIEFLKEGMAIKEEDLYQSITMSAPYIELIEEFSLSEMLDFHFHLNQIIGNLDKEELIKKMGLEKHQNKKISEFSSGMKQKLKLTLSILTNKPCLILDEPTSNLDETTKKWYKLLLDEAKKDRITIIASNDESDFPQNSIRLNIEEFK